MRIRTQTIQRIGLAVVASLDIIAVAQYVANTPPSRISHPAAPAFLLALGGTSVLPMLIAALGVVAFSFVARGRRVLTAGILGLLAFALLNESYAALALGPARPYFYSGALLFGWLLGTAFARALSRELDEEPFAEAGAIGVLVAIYVSAGCSKILRWGVNWADQMTLRGIVLTHHRISDTSLAATYAHFVASRPMLSQTLSMLTLVIELGAVVYLVHRKLWPLWGMLIIGFHVNVTILTGIGYLQAQILVALFSFPWLAIVARLRGRPYEEPAPPTLDGIAPARVRRAMMITALGLAVFATAAALSPIRSYTSLHHTGRNLD